jgi:hypothetical protein
MANIFGANGGSSGSVLSGGGGAVSLLDAARTSYRGIGLSGRARAITSSYLSQSSSGLNSILSGSVAKNATTQSLQQQIQALRASVPQSQLREDLRTVTPDPNGTNVDTTA